MRLPSPALLAPLVLLACSRRAPSPPPAPRPVVTPEPAPAPATAPAPVAPPPPAEGPVALLLPGGAEATGLTGRIDRLQVAASGDRARLVAELSGPGAPARSSTVAVDVTAAGVASPAVTLAVGAVGVRVIATTAGATDGLRTLAFGVRHVGTASGDFGNAFRFVFDGAATAPVRSEQMPLDVDELVVASDGPRWMAAAAGGSLDCYGTKCIGEDRQTQGLAYHPRAAFEASVVVPAQGALLHQAVANVDCTAAGSEVDGEPSLVEPDQTPPERCGAARRDRPYDVAIALHGAHGFVAWRTTNSVMGVTVTDEGVPVGQPVRFATGEVGAPTVAYQGDALAVVWAQRENARAPYSLRVVEWTRSDAAPAPPPARPLATGTVSAFAPALATVGPRRVLAWMEGDDRNAAVRVAATALGVEHLADHAITVSAPTAHARDPELAVAGDRAWMAWSEYAAGQRRDLGNGRVRVSPLRMP